MTEVVSQDYDLYGESLLDLIFAFLSPLSGWLRRCPRCHHLIGNHSPYYAGCRVGRKAHNFAPDSSGWLREIEVQKPVCPCDFSFLEALENWKAYRGKVELV